MMLLLELEKYTPFYSRPGPVKRPIDFLANRLDFFTNIVSYTSRLNIGQLSLCT
jgi:hypothetical protein